MSSDDGSDPCGDPDKSTYGSELHEQGPLIEPFVGSHKKRLANGNHEKYQSR